MLTTPPHCSVRSLSWLKFSRFSSAPICKYWNITLRQVTTASFPHTLNVMLFLLLRCITDCSWQSVIKLRKNFYQVKKVDYGPQCNRLSKRSAIATQQVMYWRDCSRLATGYSCIGRLNSSSVTTSGESSRRQFGNLSRRTALYRVVTVAKHKNATAPNCSE